MREQDDLDAKPVLVLTPPEGECLVYRSLGRIWGGTACDVCNRVVKNAQGIIVVDGTVFCAAECNARCAEPTDPERLARWYAFARRYVRMRERDLAIKYDRDMENEEDVPEVEFDPSGSALGLGCSVLA